VCPHEQRKVQIVEKEDQNGKPEHNAVITTIDENVPEPLDVPDDDVDDDANDEHVEPDDGQIADA